MYMYYLIYIAQHRVPPKKTRSTTSVDFELGARTTSKRTARPRSFSCPAVKCSVRAPHRPQACFFLGGRNFKNKGRDKS